MREEERRLRNKKYFLHRHFSICWLGTAGVSSLLYPAQRPPHQNPSKAKPVPWPFRHTRLPPSFAELGPPRAAWPGETHSAPSADSLLTRLGSGVRTLTHVRRTGPARAYGRNCESKHLQVLQSSRQASSSRSEGLPGRLASRELLHRPVRQDQRQRRHHLGRPLRPLRTRRPKRNA